MGYGLPGIRDGIFIAAHGNVDGAESEVQFTVVRSFANALFELGFRILVSSMVKIERGEVAVVVEYRLPVYPTRPPATGNAPLRNRK